MLTTVTAAPLPSLALTRNDRYGPLLPLCYAGLRKTIDQASSIYDLQIRNARLEETRGTEDLTSTCICIIGIDRSHTDPESVALSPQRALDAVIELARRRRYSGAIGLLIWANAVLDGMDAEVLAGQAHLTPVETVVNADLLTTMEL